MNTRSKFLTILFAFLPGAGHMFLGFMKMGLSFMSMLFGIIILTTILRLEIVLLAIPIIWFYSFFDCINKTFPTDSAAIIEDKYIMLPEPFPIFAGKHRLVLGWALTLLGLYLLADNVLGAARRMFPGLHHRFHQLQTIINNMPQFIIAVAIIVVGILMIMGKKKELSAVEIVRHEEISIVDADDNKA